MLEILNSIFILNSPLNKLYLIEFNKSNFGWIIYFINEKVTKFKIQFFVDFSYLNQTH